MKRVRAIIMGTVILLQSSMYYNHHSYAYHLEKVEENIMELQDTLDGKIPESPLLASVFGVETNSGTNEERINASVKRIVDYTENSVEMADDIRRTAKLAKAIDKIIVSQESGMKIINKAMEDVQDSEITHEIEKSMDKAIELEEKVSRAQAQVQIAIENNEKSIKINIPTDKDGNHGAGHESDNHEPEDGKKEFSHPKTIAKPKTEDKKLSREELQKLKDAKQREANKKRIAIIEEGRDAKEAQEKKH